MSVSSDSVKKLTAALIDNGLPTADEIRKAMDLAYEAGKIDGALEAVQDMRERLAPRSRSAQPESPR